MESPLSYAQHSICTFIFQATNGAVADDFLSRIQRHREGCAASVKEFRFNKKRVKVLTEAQDFPDDAKGVLYWMSRDQRVQGKGQWYSGGCLSIKMQSYQYRNSHYMYKDKMVWQHDHGYN